VVDDFEARVSNNLTCSQHIVSPVPFHQTTIAIMEPLAKRIKLEQDFEGNASNVATASTSADINSKEEASSKEKGKWYAHCLPCKLVFYNKNERALHR